MNYSWNVLLNSFLKGVLESRFSDDGGVAFTSGGGAPGSVGISSVSSSSSVNGVPQQGGSITTVNNNGEISTYQQGQRLDSRFNDDSGANTQVSVAGIPGSVGTSSFTSVSNVNGVKSGQTVSTVDNNGVRTTYHENVGK